MEKIDCVVSDTGPILHLFEIDSLKLLNIFNNIYIPPEVSNELKKNGFNKKIKNLKTIKLSARSKDNSSIIQKKYELDLGEAEVIALAKQENIKLILTDDLDARNTMKNLNFEVHGTIGVITRAYSLKLINKTETKKLILEIYNNSSLFITKDLVDWVLKKL
jgi:predicted nucleic acid-binding protein